MTAPFDCVTENTDGTITFNAVVYPVPESLRKALVLAGRTRDSRAIETIERILRMQGVRYTRRRFLIGEA